MMTMFQTYPATTTSGVVYPGSPTTNIQPNKARRTSCGFSVPEVAASDPMLGTTSRLLAHTRAIVCLFYFANARAMYGRQLFAYGVREFVCLTRYCLFSIDYLFMHSFSFVQDRLLSAFLPTANRR